MEQTTVKWVLMRCVPTGDLRAALGEFTVQPQREYHPMMVAFPSDCRVCSGITEFGQNQNPEVGSVFSKTEGEVQALSETRGIRAGSKKSC